MSTGVRNHKAPVLPYLVRPGPCETARGICNGAIWEYRPVRFPVFCWLTPARSECFYLRLSSETRTSPARGRYPALNKSSNVVRESISWLSCVWGLFVVCHLSGRYGIFIVPTVAHHTVSAFVKVYGVFRRLSALYDCLDDDTTVLYQLLISRFYKNI